MNRTKLCLLAVAALSLASRANAADLVGFSADGRYVAFQDNGVEGDRAWAKIFFIDVAKNDYAAPPMKAQLSPGLEEGHDIETAISEASTKSAAALKKLGIEPEKHGKPLKLDGGSFSGPDGAIWEIEISSTPAPGRPEDCHRTGPGKLLRASLSSPYGEPVALQHDKKLPGSRKCARNYKLDGAFSHRKGLLVLVGYEQVEGPGRTESYVMGVTGKLEVMNREANLPPKLREQGPGPILASCNLMETENSCTDYRSFPLPEAKLEESCVQGAGAWSSSPCPTANLFGTCDQSETLERFYGAGPFEEGGQKRAKRSCEVELVKKGKWIPGK